MVTTWSDMALLGKFAFNRWLYAGGQWGPDGKGFFINLLTFTIDVSYGTFDDFVPTFECKIRKLHSYHRAIVQWIVDSQKD
jgi:hypothetical protein